MSPAFIRPLTLSVSQLGDPAFLGVLWRSVAWSTVFFIGLQITAIMLVHRFLQWHGWLAWTGDLLGTIGASLLALWLFLSVAAAIGTCYLERIAIAVEARFYPDLPRASGAPIVLQIWDGIAVSLRVLLFNLVALALALAIPGIGLILGWMVAAYAIARGLFVAVAMRRMSRDDAETLYRQNRAMVLFQGGVIATIAYIPLLNLMLPMIGTAAMVHTLDLAWMRIWRARIQLNR